MSLGADLSFYELGLERVLSAEHRHPCATDVGIVTEQARLMGLAMPVLVDLPSSDRHHINLVYLIEGRLVARSDLWKLARRAIRSIVADKQTLLQLRVDVEALVLMGG